MPPLWVIAVGVAGAGLLVTGISGWRLRRVRRTLTDLLASSRMTAETLQAKIQELETSRSQLEGILHSMAEGVFAVGPTGDLLLVNAAAREILGVAHGAAAGARAGDLIRQPELHELVRQTLATAAPQRRDLTLYAPSERHLRVHATVCQTPTGRGVLVVLHDITDLKRLETLRRDFVANVSHELKTPLTAIRGAVETLLEGALSDSTHARPFVESMAEESARLTRLVDDLLTLAQVESRQPAPPRDPIPVQVFLQEECVRYSPLAQAHQIALTTEEVSPSLTVLADRRELAQAVGNLLDNAIKYNHPGGRVTVRASAAPPACHIEVEDTGIGIPAEDLPRIFERFYRVDKARSRDTGGTGLGLSIVKHVAETHGGSVQVESQSGRGSRFTLTLPLA